MEDVQGWDECRDVHRMCRAAEMFAEFVARNARR